MKSKNISIVQIEGVDGVGKSTFIKNTNKYKVRNFAFCDRGDLSDYVYRRIDGKAFTPCVIHQNALIVLLVRKYDELCRMIVDRAEQLHWSDEQIVKELQAAKLQDDFISAALTLSEEYNVIIVDVSGLDEKSTFEKVISKIHEFIHNLPCDKHLSEWNKLYKKGCEVLNLDFKVRDNQPYINDVASMFELTNQFGVYETYSDKSYPTSLIHSLGYNISQDELNNITKKYDFAYIINSKINRRPEVYSYYHEWNINKLSFMISKSLADNKFYDNAKFFVNRVFDNDYLKTIALAKATVYTARELAPYKMQTARLYEAIRANQIVFVDIPTDYNDEILSQIHKNDKELIAMLRCVPTTICAQYNTIIKNKKLCKKILDNQHRFYKDCIENIQENNF